MIFLGLGSNIGEKSLNIRSALKKMDESGVEILRKSPFYATPPWGILSQDEFVNMVCEVNFEGTAEELLDIVLQVEEDLGRYRYYKWGPRLIDIDILEFHRETRDTPRLKLPHPYYPERSFVLVPLADLEPKWIPTGYKENISTLISKIPLDGIAKLPDDFLTTF